MRSSRVVWGLSPRERGNLRVPGLVVIPLGSIPARAGEPATPARSRRCRRVYPRASGGTAASVTAWWSRQGLSPRERGNHPRGVPGNVPGGSIPARAGEPTPSPWRRRTAWVYPRASGGTFLVAPLAMLASGLSPRERGNRGEPRPIGIAEGSIPARAGEPNKCELSRDVGRSIPARAGEPLALPAAHGWTRVYPRASGGTFLVAPLAMLASGLSPRERGNRGEPRPIGIAEGSIPARAGEPNKCELSRDVGRSIPARAGEPLALPAAHGWTRVYPRASGGTECFRDPEQLCQGLSPRERGNLRAQLVPAGDRRSIPARAGEPTDEWAINPLLRVYPRASGGTCVLPPRLSMALGLSPRERGNQDLAQQGSPVGRSIPARAGEPHRPGC